jgi:hypothetical protein
MFAYDAPGRTALFLTQGTVQLRHADGCLAATRSPGQFVGQEALLGGTSEVPATYLYDYWASGEVAGVLYMWEDLLALAETNLALAMKLGCALGGLVTRGVEGGPQAPLLLTDGKQDSREYARKVAAVRERHAQSLRLKQQRERDRLLQSSSGDLNASRKLRRTIRALTLLRRQGTPNSTAPKPGLTRVTTMGHHDHIVALVSALKTITRGEVEEMLENAQSLSALGGHGVCAPTLLITFRVCVFWTGWFAYAE